MLKKLARRSGEEEFFTPVPKGYERGKQKYIFVTGSVMSGLGKGIFAASLGKLMQEQGYRISPIKFDGYLNVDAGTLNPFRHGEVFVLDDGLECDMDLGTYERMLDLDLSEANYLTGGRIFSRILTAERKGSYLGRDVQFIPHVTGEIKHFLRELAMKSKANIVIVEVGGTVGDIENQYFLEALREMMYEEGKENCCFINVTYILEPGFLGEQKSKAAQLGIRRLMELGIQPDAIACRCHNEATEKVKSKISIYSNVPLKNVISVHDVDSIYLIPEEIKGTGLDRNILEKLRLKHREVQSSKEWKGYIRRIKNPKKTITVGIIGKYTGLRDSYASVIKALEHSATHNQARISIKWIETTDIEEGKLTLKQAFDGIAGIIVPGGFGKRGAEGKVQCIRYARENNIPYLGLCYGFQMALVEFARNVLRLKDANSTEISNDTTHPVIDILPEQKKIEGLGANMRLGGRDIEVREGTRAWELYGKKTRIRERFRHRYECNPEYIGRFEKAGLVFSGKAPDHPIMQILELPSHRFFVGTQFHPEFTSRPLSPNPLYLGFVRACLAPK
ncbi:MAG: CTP synthase [DPANN group archaeon]|nr:CTP synthase [DPANN group archaeon]